MTKIVITALAIALNVCSICATEYHVATSGSDKNPGSEREPLRTIQKAASLAHPGDTITVHEGVYRERIDPPRSGASDTQRITYRAAEGEKVVITGAERVENWQKVTDDTWKATLANEIFDSPNPFAYEISGEWSEPTGRHSGMVYLDGEWFREALSLTEVVKPVTEDAQWFAKVEDENTTIWAQFPGIDPNEANVEVNVRQSVFYPSRPGINFITVRGFTLRQAATPWAGAMSEQIGLIGTHWSKGWVIENNHISHSICTGIALGRYELPEQMKPRPTAPGFVTSVELALEDGWSKEKIGSHVVRNNEISHCEKNGIHGSLGGCFSTITGNEIHDIGNRCWLDGADIAAIKFLGGVDVVIRNNHIYRSGGKGAIWLDWMCQGAQVIGNLLHDNVAVHGDLWFEMQHGPMLVANNVVLSKHKSGTLKAKSVAFVHNLFTAPIVNFPVDKRLTPRNPVHGTRIIGMSKAESGDHRLLNNCVVAPCDFSVMNSSVHPCIADGNVFLRGSTPSDFDKNATVRPGFDPEIRLIQKPDGWYLRINLDPTWKGEVKRSLVTTRLLGKTILKRPYVDLDDGDYQIDTDYFGENRNKDDPAPGPFEFSNEEVMQFKLWPREGSKAAESNAALDCAPDAALILARQIGLPAYRECLDAFAVAHGQLLDETTTRGTNRETSSLAHRTDDLCPATDRRPIHRGG